MSEHVFLEMSDVSMTFPGVKALDQVRLDIREGEVHALMGENGAGKSTLIKIISGVQQPDPGARILMDGEEVQFPNVHASIKHGINAIHQDLSLFPNLTVAENIYLGRSKNGKVDWKECDRIAVEALKRLEVQMDIHELLGNLSVAKQQLVAIARAISLSSRLLIMDEPTAALSFSEVRMLYEIIRKLKKENIAILFISHKLDEVFEVSDRVTVLKDGKYVGCKDIGELNESTLVQMMVGRSVTYEALNQESYAAEKVLEVRNISKEGNFKDISFTLHKGEILAFTGLVGAGRSETVKALFGLNPPDQGEILIHGQKAELKNVTQAMKHKIAFIPEDRHHEGLILNMSMEDNITLSILNQMLGKSRFISSRKRAGISGEYVNTLNIRPGQIYKMAKNFSGGNQQKIAVAKWLVTKPDILIIDEPTHGVDIASKTEIHKLLKSLAKQGMAIIMVSSEWQEVFALSDRVIVMRHGRIVHEDSTRDGDQNLMMEKAILGEVKA
ncbi:sugar ABC transporter ATP-binding protein [Diplocloster agilis]|uniref:Sugar ABC transporter ATP-binding protein n=1 Tax=Diplocloster agilis TaxID=2850323 RepID=A0A949JW60_9FIRM|nr:MULTISPECIES: sugar ABC transporter ATP-binding protein [Lachnospiraceae]MBU9735146.1 sugar ABC transporter ATP-binding protein [Diplocloster agilis]MBU9744141.1 sugar ABC transporter ATP-binding protein [Diplocloster agilis]MCU6735468.1 sugar ABC transporter ATP-binding protein [Suonthocola fibrivorans]SCJ74702.1 Ribose import ATP-binding protein RbsA [uncultured Clostridium sp.]